MAGMGWFVERQVTQATRAKGDSLESELIRLAIGKRGHQGRLVEKPAAPSSLISDSIVSSGYAGGFGIKVERSQ